MRLALSWTECSRENIDLCGLKAFNAAQLVKEGFGTPPFYVLTTCAHKVFCESGLKKLVKYIDAIMSSLPVVERLAVRSSCIIKTSDGPRYEDEGGVGMAGWFRSEINIPSSSLKRAIVRCYAVRESTKVTSLLGAIYGDDSAEILIGLMVQPYLAADLSAIVYTVDPFQNHQTQDMLISACYGPCMALVSGAITGDTVWLSQEGRLQRSIVTRKNIKFEETARGGFRRAKVPISDRTRLCLDENDMKNLYSLGKRIEATFGEPQNIECIRFEGRWVPLQARPCVRT